VANLTQTRRKKAKAKKIKKRKSLIRTAKTRLYITSLTNTLLQIKSFDVNKKKKQAKHSYYIKRKSQIKRAEKTPLTITTP
jgi:hypothetical protein